nr:hypothetical protein [Desulfobulbaceae bacterium]
MKQKNVIKLTLVMFYFGFFVTHQARADKLLTSEEIKSLHSISKAVLGSRAIEKKRLEAESQQVHAELNIMQADLSTLAASVRDDLMQVDSAGKPSQVVVDDTSMTVTLEQQSTFSLDFDQSSPDEKGILILKKIPEKQGQPPGPAAQVVASPKEQTASEIVQEKKSERLRIINKALDDSIAKISANRLKLKELNEESVNQNSREKQMGSAVSALPGSHSFTKRVKQERHKKLLEAAAKFENELVSMREHGADYNKIRQLQKGLELQNKLPVDEDLEPTVTTLTKHRR